MGVVASAPPVDGTDGPFFHRSFFRIPNFAIHSPFFKLAVSKYRWRDFGSHPLRHTQKWPFNGIRRPGLAVVFWPDKMVEGNPMAYAKNCDRIRLDLPDICYF